MYKRITAIKMQAMYAMNILLSAAGWIGAVIVVGAMGLEMVWFGYEAIGQDWLPGIYFFAVSIGAIIVGKRAGNVAESIREQLR